ncbi:helix-turn-helix transcriptional regulator [Clostridium sp. D33t1_170424_F3]|uniref:helix-turn-helix domain-containing protein n=1 Tax=Clostridium sp. D33t1_170424_F3 TaxID=2787099 RepID=UPI0018AA0580|nr:helix-turn-helix transcriptional regulator [Clostridium sp. D33t1_170424_F3]
MIYRRLRDLREDHDLTQNEIASLLHVVQSRYSNYERGVSNMPLDCLVCLADFYGVSTDYLLGRTNISKPYPVTKQRKNN